MIRTTRSMNGKFLERRLLDNGTEKKLPIECDFGSLRFLPVRGYPVEHALALFEDVTLEIGLNESPDFILSDQDMEVVEKCAELIIVHETLHGVFFAMGEGYPGLNNIDNWATDYEISRGGRK